MSSRRRPLAPVLPALLALALAQALAACGGGAEEATPAPTPTPAGGAGPRTLVAADLALELLGPRIVGPQGSEVESAIPGLGTMASYVACPASVATDTCDPAPLPAGTLYTYVHRITVALAESERAEDQFSGMTLFGTIAPAPGFANVIGFSREQATAALGKDGAIRVQSDAGRLSWRIIAGDGWMPGETLTVFWQSTLPPAGPQEAFRLEGEGVAGNATGPFPAPAPAPLAELAQAQ